MVNHGLSTGALFLLVGMIYDRTHTRAISDYGGVATLMPVFSVALMLVSLSSIGVPGLNGFVGEFLTMLGAFTSPFLDSYVYTVFAGFGVIFSAVYLLWMYQRVALGPVRADRLYGGHTLTDLNRREIASLIPILIFVVWIGVYPSTFLKQSAVVSKNTVEMLNNAKLGLRTNVALQSSTIVR
jgi:NADH-quinone oxidoreductase subunit M